MPHLKSRNRLYEVNDSAGDPTTWIGFLLRQYQRQKIKSDIQTGQWSRENAEEALQRLIAQRFSKMDIGIFIDALDEYVNRSEFIVSFLQDLVQRSPQSWTGIRVFCSSRPWAIFKQNFSACSGFQIHEYTEGDIFDFCNANIPLNPTSNSLLDPLVDEICLKLEAYFYE